jgi:hypothetical protein
MYWATQIQTGCKTRTPTGDSKGRCILGFVESATEIWISFLRDPNFPGRSTTPHLSFHTELRKVPMELSEQAVVGYRCELHPAGTPPIWQLWSGSTAPRVSATPSSPERARVCARTCHVQARGGWQTSTVLRQHHNVLGGARPLREWL